MSLVTRVAVPEQHIEGKRVLVYSEAWGQGGIESFLMELFRRHKAYGLAFMVFSCWDWNMSMDAELEALGIARYTVFPGYKPSHAKRLKDGLAGFDEVIDLVKPDAVYVNTMNGMGFLYSDAAKRRGVPVRVVHSHNSAYGSGQAAAKAVAHAFGKAVLGGSATDRLACSDDAGRHLFGNRAFTIANNGIDTNRFAFNAEARGELRARYGIPQDVPLFGSVGRLAEAKNPLFQIRTFAEILKTEPDARYLMVGDGDMKQQVVDLVQELGLGDRVIMPGYLPDPAPVYSALDCFLMPSLYEGLAIVCIESQCARCAIVCSEALPQEAHVTDAEVLMPLTAGEKAWAEKAVEMARMDGDRTIYAELVRNAGFDADDTALRVVTILRGKGALA